MNVWRSAVKLREAEVTVRRTAMQCELSTHTVVEAHRAFRQCGWAAVKIKWTGRPRGSGRLLSAEQERQVQWLIQNHTPAQLMKSYALWSRQAVSEPIEEHFGVRLTVRNAGRHLKRWGITPQKPLKKAYEQSSVAVPKWLSETNAAIAQRAKQEDAEILWGDETGLRSDHVRGRHRRPEGESHGHNHHPGPGKRIDPKRHEAVSCDEQQS